jgi:signal peptidase I
MDALHEAVRSRDRGRVEAASSETSELFEKHFPARADAAWRENVEVYLVAIIIAIGVRAYFLQPFTIPTGSMQPTLNGVIGHPSSAEPPHLLKRVAEQVFLGRSYVNVVSKEDDVIVELRDTKKFFFFMYTEIRGTKQRWSVRMPSGTLVRDFKVSPMMEVHAGQTIARGYVDTGDHVFVDKMSYHFRSPRRGEVFVFNTDKIETMENVRNPGGPSQFYIKRLVGLPGDRLRIAAPELFINGERAKGAPFERVMSREGDYRGYGNMGSTFLATPNSEFRVPEGNYFALGDNSYSSSDSRYWGTVPERNVTGRGFFVYWPFGAHWGLIR